MWARAVIIFGLFGEKVGGLVAVAVADGWMDGWM
jgi:hypothetical protein